MSDKTITTVPELETKVSELRARGYLFSWFEGNEIYEWLAELEEDWSCKVLEKERGPHICFTFQSERAVEFKLRFC